MKKHLLALTLTLTAALPTLAAPAPDAFAQVNEQILALPPAAQGVAIVAGVLKGAEFCRAKPEVIRGLQATVARVTKYAAPVVPQADLAKAMGLGTQAWMIMKSLPDFTCETSRRIIYAHLLPEHMEAELRRARDPRKFELERVLNHPRY